jgi:hypothetical protein
LYEEEKKKEKGLSHPSSNYCHYLTTYPKPASTFLTIGRCLNRDVMENANGNYLATAYGGSETVLFPHVLH